MTKVPCQMCANAQKKILEAAFGWVIYLTLI